MTAGRVIGRTPFARRAWQLQAALWALNRLRSSWDRLDAEQRAELRRLAAKARSNPRSLTSEDRRQLSSLVRAAVSDGR